MSDYATQLPEPIVYRGEDISLRSLEGTIATERDRQQSQVDTLNALRSRNTDLQSALAEEMARLRDLTQTLERSRAESPSFFSKMRRLLPWVASEEATRRSVEDLLRQQYERSSVRLREAADFSERLDAARADLFDEVDRLNGRIIHAAENEDLARDFVGRLAATLKSIEGQRAASTPGSVENRKLAALHDRARRLHAEHATRLRLYETAEERIGRLKENTMRLAEMVSRLQADIARYVVAASEKLDLISGQIQAIGAAADASQVLLELKASLDAMTASMNDTTRFVAETQAFFRSRVDGMIDDLSVYDSETEAVLAQNEALNEALDEVAVENSLLSSLAREIDALEVEEVAVPAYEEER